MELSVKTLVTLIFIFMGVLLLLSVLTFSILSSNARGALDMVIEYVEINGYSDETLDVISDYAESSNLTITVTPTDGTGIYEAGDRIRYEVKVGFTHIFSIVNLEKEIFLKGYTRAIEP